MNRIYIIKRQNKPDLIATAEEIINNALQQEAEGIEPHYSFYDYKKHETVTAPGWLVWSTFDGCGVVYRREDGKMIICTGVQSDFVYC